MKPFQIVLNFDMFLALKKCGEGGIPLLSKREVVGRHWTLFRNRGVFPATFPATKFRDIKVSSGTYWDEEPNARQLKVRV